MKKVLALFIMVATVLVFATIGAAPSQIAYHCVAPSDLSFKTDDGGSYQAPSGYVIASVVVKAGQECIPLPNLCYTIVGGNIGESSIVIVDSPEGDCHDLSHIEGFIVAESTPTNTPDPTPTDTPEPPTPTPTDEPTPTETPTDEPTPTETPPDPTETPTDEPTPTETPTDDPTPTPTDEPTFTPTPPDHPPTGPNDSYVDRWVNEWIDDPVFVGGIIFIGLMLVSMGVLHLWQRRVGID